jgi:Mrp family chromosome partitioning ATPase
MSVEPVMLDARAIQDLMTRIEAQFPHGRGRLVGFIASGGGEGTSTIARAYARSVATQLRRRVLFLEAGADSRSSATSLVGALQSLAGRSGDREVHAGLDDDPQSEESWSTHDEPSLWELLPRAELWYALRERFDEVVIDLPAPTVSRVGLAVAPYCDGVAVVLEADKTRAPVAESLVAHLRSVRARVLGAVLNRRRLHLPARVYRML